MPHTPKFRLFAAIAMVGFLATGVIALGLAILVGIRDVVGMTQIEEFFPALSTDPSRPRGFLAAYWLSLCQHSFVGVLGFAAAMLVFAFLFRKIVLSGLRD